MLRTTLIFFMTITCFTTMACDNRPVNPAPASADGDAGNAPADGGTGSDAGSAVATTLCSEECSFSNDGECDDGGEGAAYAECSLGTDCIDCGARMSVSDTPGTQPDAGTPQTTFPAVCQRLPLLCNDQASLDACERGDASAYSLCSILPISKHCAGVGNECPSAAQICRTAEYPLGACTHSCTSDAACTLTAADRGSVTCTEINPGSSICIYRAEGA